MQSGTYRGVSAEDRAAERRERLLAATLAVWGAPGGRVTMTRVCAEAGLSERYFYESFRNLDEALLAVLDAIASEIESVGLAAAEAAGDEPEARARASIAAFVALVADDPRKGRVAIIESAGIATLRPRRTALLRHFAHRLTEEIEDRHGPEVWGGVSGEVAGLLFIGGTAELVTAWLDGALVVTPEQIVETATAMMLGALR